MPTIRIGVVGLGKISIGQHIPAIEANNAFVLAGGASPGAQVPGLVVHDTLEQLLAGADVDAVAINTPPSIRCSLARQALRAGKHVLLEKPPCATVSALETLEDIALRGGVTLYTGWHSQHAPAVQPARAWLADKLVRRVTVVWRENVRQWHPGQHWIWQPGGLGAFDAGINALSILTTVLPLPIAIEQARFEVPGNCQAPAAAKLSGSVGEGGSFEADLDFLQAGKATWTIAIDTDGGLLEVGRRGAELLIDGIAQDIGPTQEYESIYRRFAQLIAAGRCEVDHRPLALVADSYLIAERATVADFIE